MTTTELKTLVRNTVAEHLGHNAATINEDEEMSDLGADSLDLLEIEMTLSEELSLDVLEDYDFVTPSESVNSLTERLGKLEGVLG